MLADVRFGNPFQGVQVFNNITNIMNIVISSMWAICCILVAECIYIVASRYFRYNTLFRLSSRALYVHVASNMMPNLYNVVSREPLGATLGLGHATPQNYHDFGP